MPVVPSLDPSQEVTPSQAPTPGMSSVATPGLLNQGAAQIGQFGDALGGAANAASSVAIDVANRMNQTRVDDAVNQTQAAAYTLKYDPQTGYANKTGVDAITPNADGLMPADAALSKLNDTAAQVRATLQPEQQRLYDMHYNSFATSFRGEAMAHEAEQSRVYSLQTNSATSQLAQDAAAQDFANPDLLDQHVTSAGIAGYKSAKVQGFQGPTLDVTVKTAETATVMAAYKAAVEKDDFASASAIQKRYGAFLTADAAVQVDTTAKTINNNQLATDATKNAFAGLASATTPAGKAFGANIMIESAGKQLNPDGTPLTSPKGAVGVAQMLPATAQETALKHGVPWDENKFRTDPQYNANLGQMYWSDQLAANGGDVRKADAAYNAGPGAVQAAVKKATTAGKPDAWLSYLPAETQAYVPKVANTRLGGAYYQPTKEDAYIRINNDPTLAANPPAKALALASVDKMFDAHNEAMQQRYTQYLNGAQAIVARNGGDLTQVPPGLLAQLDPKDLPALQKYAGEMRTGGTVTNPAVYADMVTNMPKYAAMPGDQWMTVARANLSQSDFETLTKQRADLVNNTGSNAPGSVNLRAVNESLSARLQSMGINPYPKQSGFGADPDTVSQVGAIRQFTIQSVLDAQKQTGKKFTEGDIESHIDRLFTVSINVPHTGAGSLWGMVNRAPTAYNMMSMTPDEMPSSVRSRLTSDLQAHGVAKPTSGQLMGAYWQDTVNQAKAAVAAAATAKATPKVAAAGAAAPPKSDFTPEQIASIRNTGHLPDESPVRSADRH